MRIYGEEYNTSVLHICGNHKAKYPEHICDTCIYTYMCVHHIDLNDHIYVPSTQQHICAHICANLPAYMCVENTTILCIYALQPSPGHCMHTPHVWCHFPANACLDELLRFISLSRAPSKGCLTFDQAKTFVTRKALDSPPSSLSFACAYKC